MNLFASPALVEWEITRACTRSCEFCYNCSSNHLTPKLEEREVLYIAEKIADCNPLIVNITGGEPLMYGDTLVKAMEVFKRKNIFVKLSTNCDLIREAAGMKAAALSSSLVLPITDKLNQLIGEKSYKNILHTLTAFRDKPVEINLLLNGKSKEQLPEILQSLKDYSNIEQITLIPIMNVNEKALKALQLSKSDLNDVMVDTSEYKKKYQQNFRIFVRDDNTDVKNLINKKQPYYSVYVKEKGNTILNQWLQISGGNILDHDLKEIWNNHMKNFWFHGDIRQKFREFKYYGQQEFLYLTNYEIEVSMDEFIKKAI
ncbi:radical SAM protein [Alkaliphilus crotonatoxidans]